eukprot:1270560-Pleurochrysis_carterae.AAC.2
MARNSSTLRRSVGKATTWLGQGSKCAYERELGENASRTLVADEVVHLLLEYCMHKMRAAQSARGAGIPQSQVARPGASVGLLRTSLTQPAFCDGALVQKKARRTVHIVQVF